MSTHCARILLAGSAAVLAIGLGATPNTTDLRHAGAHEALTLGFPWSCGLASGWFACEEGSW